MSVLEGLKQEARADNCNRSEMANAILVSDEMLDLTLCKVHVLTEEQEKLLLFGSKLVMDL